MPRAFPTKSPTKERLCKWCYKILDSDGDCPECHKKQKDEEQIAFEKILDECKELRWKKNLDYGGAYKVCGTKGIIVRLVDKVMRMKNIVLDNNEKTIPETIEQNLMDTVILAANALYLERGGK
jgi:RNA polymerase subunit RPABC4/transcription elongation factor Spt4